MSAAPRRLPQALRWGATLTTLVVLASVFGPFLVGYSADTRDVDHVLAGPSFLHLLGTDEDGYDTLARVLAGGRLALIVGLGTMALSVGIGVLMGGLAGYFGGLFEQAVIRTTDVLMAFPGILLALLVLFVTADPGVITVIGALSLTSWAGHARLVRGLVITVRGRDHVLAARCMGAGHLRILSRYILPEIAGPITVQATFAIAGAVLGEASLSFLGLGPQGVVSWGGLLEQGAILFLKTPALVLSAGGALLLLLAGMNLMGDGLRDHLDPRLAGQRASAEPVGEGR